MGFSPTTPHNDDGTLMDPPVSVPMDIKAIPVETATAEPLLEPPDIFDMFQGFLVLPQKGFNPVIPDANSFKLLVPISIVPCFLIFLIHVASAFGTYSDRIFEPIFY